MCYNWFPAAHFNNKIVHAHVLCTAPDISLLLTSLSCIQAEGKTLHGRC